MDLIDPRQKVVQHLGSVQLAQDRIEVKLKHTEDQDPMHYQVNISIKLIIYSLE